MKSFSFAVAMLVAGVVSGMSHAGPVLERTASGDTPDPATTQDASLRSHFTHARPTFTAAQRAAEVAAFESMAKSAATLPYYVRSYSVPVVNENLGAMPPVPTVMSFQHTVIGTDPSSFLVQGALGVSSTLPVRLIPVVITTPDGKVYDPNVELVPGQLSNSMLLDQVSPLFTYQSVSLGGVQYGNTQLLDAWVRGERWRYAQYLPNYHLYLTPSVGATLRLAPTKDQLQDVSKNLDGSPTQLGAKLGRIFMFDASWLNDQIKAYVQTQGIDPTVIPVFVTSYNITANLGGQFAAGYHNSFGTQTFIWHTYLVPQQTAVGSQPVQGLILEHELAELIDHPFPALTPDQQACNPTGYESGDPLEFNQADFTLANSLGMNYKFQDLTFAGWNEGEYPSTGILGRYSIQNAFRFPCF